MLRCTITSINVGYASLLGHKNIFEQIVTYIQRIVSFEPQLLDNAQQDMWVRFRFIFRREPMLCMYQFGRCGVLIIRQNVIFGRVYKINNLIQP